MKRDAEEPVAGDGGSICAVRITKRGKLEEPEAADGITRRSPELVAADGAGISTKRALNLEKPSKKEKGAEEKSKRSKKKRAEEKNKQHNKVEVVDDLSMGEKIMARLAELDKQRAEEKSKIYNLEKRVEDVSISIEKIASKIKIEEQVAGDGIEVREMAYNKVMGEMPDNEAGVKKMPDNDAGVKKKKVVRWRLSKKLLNYLRTKEVMGLLATDEAPRPLWANKMAGELFPENSKLKGEIQLKEKIAAEFQEDREFDAHVLYQYRTKGYVEIEEEVSDEEVDEEVSDKEDDVEDEEVGEEVSDKEDHVEADGILVCKERSRKLEKPSKEKGAVEKGKRSNQEKWTEGKNKQSNKVEMVHDLSMEEKMNAELAEVEKNKKRLLTLEVSKAHMMDYLFYEVTDYMLLKPMVTFRECNRWQVEGIRDPYTDARHFASRRRSIKTHANVLQQYRTNGSAVIQFESVFVC